MNLKTYISNWNFVRILRLALGILILGQALYAHDAIMGILGGLLLFLAITNTGCCGSGSCTKNACDN